MEEEYKDSLKKMDPLKKYKAVDKKKTFHILIRILHPRISKQEYYQNTILIE